MSRLKRPEDIEAMARAGRIIGTLFQEVPAEILPGATTADVDRFAEEFIRSHDGAVPAFKGLYGFPASVCASVNHEVVHGIPSAYRALSEGDIITVDVGVRLDGWYADSAVTFPVGEIDGDTERLLDITRGALGRAIEAATVGNRLGDIGHAVQSFAEEAGFSVVRELVGHGIGREMHEDPQVANFGQPGRGEKLEEGMVLAIEPMINAGTSAVRTLPDRWTVVTADHRRSAHFEHTVAITASGPRVLTSSNGG
ncbi:MAG TPA: type I methionyl aminopeptidase [Longimicrobiales bacterium]|nr:type I methionyl aminopeptidase [Longimicrobiales bacterium]